MSVKFFKNQVQLRKWFEKNHEKLSEQWIGYYKKTTKIPSITWDESVEEAICFGWIDGLRKSIDEKAYKIRFTPRKPNSNWSLKNMKTIEYLIKEKKMKAAGMAIFEKRKEAKTGVYAFEQREAVKLSKEFESIFKASKNAWTFFNNQAPSYQKTALYWVTSAKQEKTRIKRLNDLIEASGAGLRAKPFRSPS